jgi:hypothetical protein
MVVKSAGSGSGSSHDAPTAASIKTLYEANADTNAFQDADESKLDAIEASADVTDTTNVNSAGAVMNTDYNANSILLATSDDTPAVVTISASEIVGRKSSGGPVSLTAAEARTILNVESGSTADQSNAEIKTAYEANADTNEFSNAEQTKLSGIETSADVTDEANVTAALPVDDATALVDSGTDKAMRIDVGAVSDSTTRVLTMPDSNIDLTPGSGSFATEAEGTLAAAALPKSGGAMTGAITTNSTFDGRNVATDGTKLDGIEAGDAVAFAIALG